ncbi:MAG: hypothetical protein IPG53_07730 [Ignavibacteriales bacterium]|nr:hypothetical protein [Ignavibacteriales bacterium]
MEFFTRVVLLPRRDYIYFRFNPNEQRCVGRLELVTAENTGWVNNTLYHLATHA